MREITDEEMAAASVAELEALEFRLYAELRNREESTLAELTLGDPNYGYVFDGPF